MKKATLPINYIVALIFGIVAVGILGYWIFVQSGRTTETGIKAECDAKAISYCQAWNATGFQPIKPDWGVCGEIIKTKDDCKTKYNIYVA